MLRLIRRNLSANRIRMAFTAAAVVLGVAFITSSFVLADGFRGTFRELGSSIHDGTDFSVRPVDGLGDPMPFDDRVVDTIAALPGVAAVAGQVEMEGVIPVRSDGTLAATTGVPQIGYAWIDDPALNPFTITDGRAPVSGAEFTLDSISVADNDFMIGGVYDIITPTGLHPATLVGASRFGPDNATLGATLLHLPLATAQDWFGVPGLLRTAVVRVNADADAASIAQAITDVLPAGTELIDQATLIDETVAQYTAISDLIGTALLVFAGISLLVSSLIIANTFSVVVSQRTRELGVLRALGASRRQTHLMVVAEAAFVGVGASALGIAAGVGVAIGLLRVFEALGLNIPDVNVIVAGRTWIVSLLSGLGVTVIAALRPARRAGRTAPIAAIRGNTPGAEPSMSAGAWHVGVLLTVAAFVAIVVGLNVNGATQVFGLAAGAVVAVIAAAVLAPFGVRPFVGAVGRILFTFHGLSGIIARRNATRNPRRTASTASALMIGLSLVTVVVVAGASIKQHVGAEADAALQADVILTATPDPDVGLSPNIAAELLTDTRFSAVSPVRFGEINLDGDDVSVSAVDRTVLAELIDINVLTGALTTSANDVALQDTVAERLGLKIGDTALTLLPNGKHRTVTVTATYHSEFAEAVVGLAWRDEISSNAADASVFARFDSNVPPTSRDVVISELQGRFPQANVDTRAEYRDGLVGQVQQVLVIINLMVVLTVVIALLGIANTLALAVFERTRELGLLRAVGMTRRRVRQTIHCEAILIALFGAGQGVALGLLLGTATVAALPDTLADGVTIPMATIASIAASSVIAGMIAAHRPARRASRLDILDAIATT